MRLLPLLLLAAAALPTVAAAQPLTVQPGPYQSAPWWMREPIIASQGSVFAEVPPNRVRLSASFEVVAPTAPEATRQVAEKVRGLNQALSAHGADRVRLQTAFSTRPLYAQYKDKQGNLLENQREDKIDRYAVTASVSVQVRDMKLVERVYASLIAAKPTGVQPAYFSLEPDNALNAAMAKAAVADAAARARAAAADTGARLGAVKLIDPTSRACSTDVLIAGAPRSYGGGYGNDVSEVVVTAERRQQAMQNTPVAISAFTASIPSPAPPQPPPPPPPGSAEAIEIDAAALQISLQPPPQRVNAQACVIYALGS